MVWVIVLSNIIAVMVSFLFLNQLVRLTHVKAALLVPFLLVLTAFGAYTAHNTFADILLMLGRHRRWCRGDPMGLAARAALAGTRAGRYRRAVSVSVLLAV